MVVDHMDIARDGERMADAEVVTVIAQCEGLTPTQDGDSKNANEE